MKAKKRRYKDVVRERVVSVRLSEAEFFRLKASGLGSRRSMSALLRARMADLIGGAAEAPAGGTVVNTGATA